MPSRENLNFSSSEVAFWDNLQLIVNIHLNPYVTGPGKTGLIYTKNTCLYYGMYLLCCMCYPKSVNCIEFLMDFCII